MSDTTMKIHVPSEDVVANFKTIEDVKKYFGEAEIVELVCRQCDAARWAKNYRQRAANKKKLMEQALKDAGIDVNSL